jgi:tetratricopeptide (TPR) repeat protein
VTEGDDVDKRLPRPRALTILTALGLILAAGALVAITGMTAAAVVPPNLGKALEAQKRKAAERPQDASAFNDLGNLLVLAGQPDQAEAAYRHAVELDPRRSSAQFNLALLLQQQGKTAEARQLYEKVVELDPRHAWAHYQLGALAERRGDKPRAVREYAQAFRLDPQLAFRQVNPQIVDNGLVTESLLQAYRRSAEGGEAPAIYDDPSRIRDLMVPKPPKDAAADNRAAEAAPAAIAAPAGGRTNVLRQRDLPAGANLGQATPPGTRPGAPGRPGMAGTPNSYVPPNYQQGGDVYQGVRQWARPNPNMDATQPGTVVTPPPAGLYYRPQVTSTGRLGSEIVPNE